VVVFKWTEDALVLTVEDNGKGFHPAFEKGMGLLGIDERVGRLSGHVQVTSSRGKGDVHPRYTAGTGHGRKRSSLMIRTALADDHIVLRVGLKSLLERQRDFAIVGEAGDGRELLRVVDEVTPDVVITDIGMPKLNGGKRRFRLWRSTLARA